MSKIEDAKRILSDLGLPVKQQNDRSAGTFLALLALKNKTHLGKIQVIRLSVFTQ